MSRAPIRVPLKKVEHQGSESQNACGGDDNGGPSVPPSQTTLTSGNRPETLTHTPPGPRSTAWHGTQRARQPANPAQATGQRTRARTPHHHAGTAPQGSHREHGNAKKRIKNGEALPQTGVYIRSTQVRPKGKPKGTAMYKMTGCACNAGSRAGQACRTNVQTVSQQESRRGQDQKPGST